MLFEEKRIVLKDGAPAVLRPARVEDAAALVQYLITTAGETEFILAYPDERAGMTVEQEERFLQGIMESPCNVFIVCEVNGEIAGNCSLQFNPKRKVRHRGAVAITLYKKHWNRGIGTAMFRLMENRTSLIIAHRLSTIRDADLIVVMDNGRITEMGTQEELLDLKGNYYRLYMTQFAGQAT